MNTTETHTESLTAWDRVQLARNVQRPHTLDFIRGCCENFVELHGDRRFGDDNALVGGLATFQGRTVMVIGHQKGHNARENVQRHFGMPRPEGYRKALRLFRHAEKFGFPLLCFIDTPGADPEKESEERGQANAIAECIMALTNLRVPIIATVIGEGGSGGALAIGVADRVFMMENAIYSVISPEGCASILWRDAAKAPDAARAMRITAHDLLELGIADAIIAEPEGGAHTDASAAVAAVGVQLQQAFAQLAGDKLETMLANRYTKYRSIGVFHEHQQHVISNQVALAALPFV